VHEARATTSPEIINLSAGLTRPLKYTTAGDVTDTSFGRTSIEWLVVSPR